MGHKFAHTSKIQASAPETVQTIFFYLSKSVNIGPVYSIVKTTSKPFPEVQKADHVHTVYRVYHQKLQNYKTLLRYVIATDNNKIGNIIVKVGNII